ncbi:MAG: hypothetical protein WBP58_14840 [Chitinophagaceae bacterium]
MHKYTYPFIAFCTSLFLFASCAKDDTPPGTVPTESGKLSKIEIEQDQYPWVQQPPQLTVDTFTYIGNRINSIERIARVPFSPSQSYLWVYRYEPGRILASVSSGPTRRIITIDPSNGYLLTDSTDPKIATSFFDTTVYFLNKCTYESNGFIKTNLLSYKRIQSFFSDRLITTFDQLTTYTNDGANITTKVETVTQRDSTFSYANGSLLNVKLSVIRIRKVVTYGNEEVKSPPLVSPLVFGKANKKLPVREDATYEVSNDGGVTFSPISRVEKLEYRYEFKGERLVRVIEKLSEFPEKRTTFFYL